MYPFYVCLYLRFENSSLFLYLSGHPPFELAFFWLAVCVCEQQVDRLLCSQLELCPWDDHKSCVVRAGYPSSSSLRSKCACSAQHTGKFFWAHQHNLCITTHLNFTPCHFILFPRVNLKTNKSILTHRKSFSVCHTCVRVNTAGQYKNSCAESGAALPKEMTLRHMCWG